MKLNLTTKFDFSQKPSLREKVIFIAAFAVFCIGFTKSCVVASLKTSSTFDQQIKEQEDERVKQMQLKSAAEASEKDSTVKDAKAPKRWIGLVEDMENSLEAMTQVVNLYGVELIKCNFSELKSEGSLLQKSLTLNLSGSYAAIGKYLEFLENLPAPLVVETFILEGPDQVGEDIRVNIQGSFYASK